MLSALPVGQVSPSGSSFHLGMSFVSRKRLPLLEHTAPEDRCTSVGWPRVLRGLYQVKQTFYTFNIPYLLRL